MVLDIEVFRWYFFNDFPIFTSSSDLLDYKTRQYQSVNPHVNDLESKSFGSFYLLQTLFIKHIYLESKSFGRFEQ